MHEIAVFVESWDVAPDFLNMPVVPRIGERLWNNSFSEEMEVMEVVYSLDMTVGQTCLDCILVRVEVREGPKMREDHNEPK